MFTFTRSAKTLLSLARDSCWKRRRFDQFSTMNNRPGNAFWQEKMVKIRKTLSEEFKKSSPFPTIALIVFDFAVVYGVFHVITQYGVNYTICVGPSMIPTLNEKGDFVLIDVFSYRMLNKEYRVGDVVICVCPYDPDKTVCKRIAAVSGDIVFVSRTRSVNNSYVNPFSNVPSINGDLEKVHETNVSGTGTAITNRAAAAAASARNHTSHSDKAMEGHITQEGEGEQVVVGLQSMVGTMTHVMVPGNNNTVLSHRIMEKVIDATTVDTIATVVDASSTAASSSSSSSSSRVNSRVHRFIGRSSSDAPPRPSDESSTPSSFRPPTLVVVAGDDSSEEKRMYPRDNSSGGHGSASVVPIKKAEENQTSKEAEIIHGVVSGKKNGGFNVEQGEQGTRPRMHTQDAPPLVVSTVPLSHTPSLSPEDTATTVSTRIPSTPPSSVSSPTSPSSPTTAPAPAPSSSFVTQYSEPVVIPPGHVWLAGDNINNSTDSRFYGPVPTGLLRGRVFTKLRWGIWPFEVIKSTSTSSAVVTTSTTSSPSKSSISKA